MDISEKIRQRMTELDIKAIDIARQIGATRGSVSQWLSGISKPGGKYIIPLAECLKVEPAWLIDETPSMSDYYKAGAKIGETAVKAFVQAVKEPQAIYAEFVEIPYYKEVLLSAGNGAVVEGETTSDSLTFRRDWLELRGLEAKDLRVVVCRGDSMEPILRDKDIVLVDTRQQPFQDSRIYAINYDGEARIKRIIKNFDGSIILKSDNTDFEAETVTKNQLEDGQLIIIGRAVWHGGEL